MSQVKGKKIAHPDMERALRGDETSEDTTNDFQLFGEDIGPQLYHPPNDLVTKPVIAKNLPRVFANLPIHGIPEPGISLKRFNKNKLKQFVGVTDKQFRELAKYCSPDHLKTEKEVVMDPALRDQLLMNVHAEPKVPLHDDDDPPTLKILEKNKERKEEDKDGQYLNKTLKYKHVHLIPLEQQARTLSGNPPLSQAAESPQTVVTRKSKKSGRYKKHAKTSKSSVTTNYTDYISPIGSGAVAKPASAATGDAGLAAVVCENALAARDGQLLPGTDILIVIRIYKPFDYEEYKNKSDGSLFNLFYHDLVLTGRNKVSDIKDGFVCNEKGSTKEKSRNGFLFIKNEFFVDNDEKAADHANSLRQWCSMRNFGNFPKRDMRACKLDELEYKLGNPDVYIHDTSCEHIIIFSEIRLLNANDPLCLYDYPRITSKSLHQKAPFCYNCVELNPKWIVSGCTRIPFNMALFCQQCLKKVLYDDDGKKNCKFKAYPYKGAENKK